MSMHDIEDFAEQMVHLVNDSEISNEEKIELIYNIYKFHDSWDTSFTKLRVFQILADTGYFYLFDPPEHPDYEKYKDFFDRLPESNEMYIYEDPVAGCTGDAEPTSYWLDYSYDSEKNEEFPLNKMCCEAGSPVWSYFVGAEKAPKKMPELQLFSRLTELAAENNDIYAMGELYFIVSYVFFDLESEEDKQLLEKMKPVLLKDEVMAVLKSLYLDYYVEGFFEEWDEEAGEDKFPENVIKEWYGYYFDWKERQGSDENAGGASVPAEDFRDLILNGGVDAFFDRLAAFNMNFSAMKGLFLFGKLYEEITPEGHDKILAYDTGKTENEEIKAFVADYKDWAENKGDAAYYARKAHESLNAEQNMAAAQYYILEGLKIDPENTILTLYEIYIFMNYAEDEEGHLVIKEYTSKLDKMIENGLERQDLTAFAYYLKAAGLYRLGETESSKTVMKKAAETSPEYQAVYTDFFGNEN